MEVIEGRASSVDITMTIHNAQRTFASTLSHVISMFVCLPCLSVFVCISACWSVWDLIICRVAASLIRLTELKLSSRSIRCFVCQLISSSIDLWISLFIYSSILLFFYLFIYSLINSLICWLNYWLYICRKYKEEGLPDNSINIKLTGSAGQSFCAFLVQGVTVMLEGDANDYVGKVCIAVYMYTVCQKN